MAEWRTITTHNSITTSTFQVIGSPFPFMRASPVGNPEQYLRCFAGCSDEDQDRLRYKQQMEPEKDVPPYYDLIFKRVVDGDDEIFEDGWYLSGIGHHLMWCGAVLEEAVDEAQELIAWDGRNPTELLLLPARRDTVDGVISHKLPPPDLSLWDDGDPLLELLYIRRAPYGKKGSTA